MAPGRQDADRRYPRHPRWACRWPGACADQGWSAAASVAAVPSRARGH